MFYSFDHFVTFLFLSKNHNNCIQYVCNIFHANYNLNDFFFFLMEIFKFPNQRFWNIYKSFSSPFFFSQSLKEVTTAAIYEVIIVIFSVNLPMVFINKFFFNPITRTSRTSSRRSSTKKVQATQNFIKNKMKNLKWSHRSKSKFYMILLFDSSVFFWGGGFRFR